MQKFFRNGIISLALLAASACGFHLRNSASIPSALEPIFIGGPASGGALGRTLSYQLKNSNTAVTLHSAEANYQLWILSENQEQRIISLDRRGLAAEYGITTTIEFELHDKSGNRVLGPQKIEERRTVTNNPDNALTTGQDIGIVTTDMEQVLAAQVVRRLSAYATHKQSVDKNSTITSEPQNNSSPSQTDSNIGTSKSTPPQQN